MKILSIYLLAIVLLTSCASTYRQIGSLNMLADRRIDKDANYQKLVTDAGSSKKELKKTTALKIEDAIDNVVNKVPGGKYLTNVKIYVVNGDYLAVSGDVWGQPAAKIKGRSEEGQGSVINLAPKNVNDDSNNSNFASTLVNHFAGSPLR